MGAVLLVALLILLFFGLGFAVKVLWFLAIALLVVWIVGFVARSGEGRWYRW